MTWSRRQFLGGASALIASHAGIFEAATGSGSAPAKDGDTPRILALRLACAAPLATMRDFYHGTLGLPVLAEDAHSLTIAGGRSRLTFVTAEPEDGEPFYHFAFNIPENKILLAREWQLRRTRLIPPGRNLRDPDLPEDVVDYRHWNAHSLFFWDPAGNLLEYIARHDLRNPAPGPFTADDLLYASEIGIVVDDVDATAAELKKAFALEQYRSGSNAFRPIGDELGLLIAMKTGRKLGFGEAKPAAVFPTAASVSSSAAASYSPSGLPYEIVSS